MAMKLDGAGKTGMMTDERSYEVGAEAARAGHRAAGPEGTNQTEGG